MKQAILCVLASLCCLVSSAPQVYYITPTQPADPQGNCRVNGTTLRPCCTLQQLIVNGFSSHYSGSVELQFLPGTHLMPEKETLNVSNFSEVVIRPWKEELEVIIECVRNDHGDTSFWLQSIIELKIASLRFSSCKVQYSYENNTKAERSVNITKSVFERSTVTINSTESDLNVAVSNCTFSWTQGMALSILTPDFDLVNNLVLRRITIAHLQITNTLFQDNRASVSYSALQVEYTDLTISRCSFINNIGNYSAAAVFAIFFIDTSQHQISPYNCRKWAHHLSLQYHH